MSSSDTKTAVFKPCPLCAAGAAEELKRIESDPHYEPGFSMSPGGAHDFKTADEWKKHLSAHPNCFEVPRANEMTARQISANFKKELTELHLKGLASGVIRSVCEDCKLGGREYKDNHKFQTSEELMKRARETTCDPNFIPEICDELFRIIRAELKTKTIACNNWPNWFYNGPGCA